MRGALGATSIVAAAQFPSEGLAGSAEGAGLVSVSTTQKPLDVLCIDKDESRFVRLQKNVGVAAKLHLLELRGQPLNVVMVTPTYRPGVHWEPAHLASYTDHVRKWYYGKTGEKLRYVWVAEVQDGKRREDGVGRGVIHYHAIFFLCKGLTMPKADKQGWWPHGMTNTMRCTNPVAYVMSYAKKQANVGGLPKGARRYGIGGLERSSCAIRRWINWPGFVQARASVHDDFRRAEGGGWVNRATGEWWPSEYGLLFRTRGHIVVVRLRDHGRPLANVCGPFSWVEGHD
jgi:hypothetical protein